MERQRSANLESSHTSSSSSSSSTSSSSSLSSTSWTPEDHLTMNAFGAKLYPTEYYEHIVLHYDHEKQQHLLFASLPLKRKSKMRMSALLEWKTRNPHDDDADEKDAQKSKTKRSKKHNKLLITVAPDGYLKRIS